MVGLWFLKDSYVLILDKTYSQHDIYLSEHEVFFVVTLFALFANSQVLSFAGPSPPQKPVASRPPQDPPEYSDALHFPRAESIHEPSNRGQDNVPIEVTFSNMIRVYFYRLQCIFKTHFHFIIKTYQVFIKVKIMILLIGHILKYPNLHSAATASVRKCLPCYEKK